MRPDPETLEFEVVTLHPGITRDRIRAETGWPIRFAGETGETPPPEREELETLRDLHARTAKAHGVKEVDS